MSLKVTLKKNARKREPQTHNQVAACNFAFILNEKPEAAPSLSKTADSEIKSGGTKSRVCRTR